MAKNCQRCGWALTDGNVVVESGDGCLGCAGLFVPNRERLSRIGYDVLGRPVPEWAREAFSLLNHGSRRVLVCQAGAGSWAHPRPFRASDANVCRYSDGSVDVYIYGNGHWENTRGTEGSVAEAARRALAAEAERLSIAAKEAQGYAPGLARLMTDAEAGASKVERGIAYPDQPMLKINMDTISDEAKAACIEALRALSSDHRTVFSPEPESRHNATCPRCYGPAYHGFGYKPECERVGGCLADREPRVCPQHRVGAALSHRVTFDVFPAWDDAEREIGWCVTEVIRQHPTHDLAIAAWREAMLSRAKREAGL